jgi:hypothetical protein
MGMIKCVICWVLFIALSPILIVLILSAWLLLFLIWEIGYWAQLPYLKFIKLVEEVFSGGRAESD